jgi:hypothetical protein
MAYDDGEYSRAGSYLHVGSTNDPQASFTETEKRAARSALNLAHRAVRLCPCAGTWSLFDLVARRHLPGGHDAPR